MGFNVKKAFRRAGKTVYEGGKMVGRAFGLVKPDKDPALVEQKRQAERLAEQTQETTQRSMAIATQQYAEQERALKEDARKSIGEAVAMLGATGQLKYAEPGQKNEVSVPRVDTGTEEELGALPEGQKSSALSGRTGKVGQEVSSGEIEDISQIQGATATGSALMNLSQYRDLLERERKTFVRQAKTNLRTIQIQGGTAASNAREDAAALARAIREKQQKQQIQNFFRGMGGVVGAVVGGVATGGSPQGIMAGARYGTQFGSMLGGA